MQRQVAIGAVVGFALTVVFLSMCDVRMSASQEPAAADAAVAAPPAPVKPRAETLQDTPLKPMQRFDPGMPRPSSQLRRTLIHRLTAGDGGP